MHNLQFWTIGGFIVIVLGLQISDKFKTHLAKDKLKQEAQNKDQTPV